MYLASLLNQHNLFQHIGGWHRDCTSIESIGDKNELSIILKEIEARILLHNVGSFAFQSAKAIKKEFLVDTETFDYSPKHK